MLNQLEDQQQLKTALAANINELPAGGSDPSRFDWYEVWYPVHYVEDLDKNQPTSFTLLGENIVIWWDKTQQSWTVFADQCPHRLAPLSEGRINEEGLLECPYHGWAFSGLGECEKIPQQLEDGKAEESRRACVRGFPTTVKQGLLFVYPGKPENAAQTKIPIVEPLEETKDEWICLNTVRDLPYDALTLIENVVDASHVPYTHHGSVGNRANVSPVDLELLESGKNGFQGVWAEGPRKGKLGKQNTTFIAPGLMWHDLTSKQFGRTLTVVYATPIRKGECRLFARFPFKFSSKLPALFIKLTPKWYSHIGQNAILEDDQIFLHYQERYLENKGGISKFPQAFFLPTKADLYVSELLNWVNQYSIDPFAGETLPQPMSKEALLDRYHSHTINCASCRQALANIQKLRMAVGIIVAIAWTITPLLTILNKTSLIGSIVEIVVMLIVVAAWLALGRLEKQFYQGRETPPRNLRDKKPLKS